MKTFKGLPLNPVEAFANIEILLAATEIMFSADNASLNRIGTMILNAAHEYCSAARDFTPENENE
jgi:hypothetical protein